MPAFDYYAAAGAIADQFEGQGDGATAASMRNAIAAGAMGSEILSNLRVALRAIDLEQHPKSLQRRIRDLLERIDRAFD